MSQEGSIEETRPIPTVVMSQQVETSGSYDASGESLTGSYMDRDDKMNIRVSDVVQTRSHEFYTRDSNQKMQMRTRDEVETSVESQSDGEETNFPQRGSIDDTKVERIEQQRSNKLLTCVGQCEQYEERARFQPGGLLDGGKGEPNVQQRISNSYIEAILRSHQHGGDTVSVDSFRKMCQEVASLKLEMAKRHSGVDLDRERQALEDENFRLKEELREIQSKLILDENGHPMELKQHIFLREENARLENKVSNLEKRLEELLPPSTVQHDTSPESSIMRGPSIDRLLHENEELKDANHKLLKEKTELEERVQKIHHTVDEVFSASADELQKLLKEEMDKNRKLVEDCKLLREQVDTYAEDYRAEKEQQKKKESQWDFKFTRMRATNEKLTREIKAKEMEITRLQAQYHKEFESKMKIQEKFEHQKHVPSQATERTQGPYPSSQTSVMQSDVSFELNTCRNCSATFNSICELELHQQSCCGRGRKQTPV